MRKISSSLRPLDLADNLRSNIDLLLSRRGQGLVSIGFSVDMETGPGIGVELLRLWDGLDNDETYFDGPVTVIRAANPFDRDTCRSMLIEDPPILHSDGRKVTEPMFTLWVPTFSQHPQRRGHTIGCTTVCRGRKVQVVVEFAARAILNGWMAP